MNIKITVLSDNFVVARNVLGEHGLALLVTTPENSLLFDSGQGRVLLENAQALQADLGKVDRLVISHGHYDHTGGLADLLAQLPQKPTVYAHPQALSPKYQRKDAKVVYIGISDKNRAAISGTACRLITTRQSVQVAPGIWTTGEIPRRHPEETPTTPFCRDPAGTEADELWDDQALFSESHEGLIVILGCTHAGLINTLERVQELGGGRRIRAVIGGLHLGAATDERLAWTIKQLAGFAPSLLTPLHCTGQRAAAALWNAFPTACRPAGVGMRFEL